MIKMYIYACIYLSIYARIIILAHTYVHTLSSHMYIYMLCVCECRYMNMCTDMQIYLFLCNSLYSGIFFKKQDHSLSFYPRVNITFYFMPEFFSNQLLKIVPQTGSFVHVDMLGRPGTLNAIQYFKVICELNSKVPWIWNRSLLISILREL